MFCHVQCFCNGFPFSRPKLCLGIGEKEIDKRSSKPKCITISNSVREDIKRLIQNIDDGIVVHLPKEVVEYVKKKTVIFKCKNITNR